MNTKHYRRERGFTLVEMLMSVVASGVLMLTIMSLIGISNRSWKQGNAVRELSAELAISLESLALDIKGAEADSVSVSANNDTLRIGADLCYYVDDSNNLVIDRNGNTFEFLEGMVSNFTVETPVVGASGDTLESVSVTLVVQKDSAHDSTTVWLTPRL